MYLTQDDAEIRLLCSRFHEAVFHNGLSELSEKLIKGGLQPLTTFAYDYAYVLA